MWTRSLYNFLATSSGDNSCQGIMDTSNRYYAQDLWVTNYPTLTNENTSQVVAEVAKEMVTYDPKNRGKYDFGKFPDLGSIETSKAVVDFATRLAAINRDTAQRIFNNYIGTTESRNFCSEQLLLRARALPKLIESAQGLS